MNKLKMKAKAGVTLVELLVVILIVTILSVSMLPLLKPFVVEAQYAAEAIPVIGNLRTKVGVFQYDKGKLPCAVGGNLATDFTTPFIETWVPSDGNGGIVGNIENWGTVDAFEKAAVAVPNDGTYVVPSSVYTRNETDSKIGHFGLLCDIDWQELKGKRCRPCNYQYVVMRNGSDYAYFLGCFGDGNGLPLGTGYAVCELVLSNHKYVGTWKRYKPVSDPNGAGDAIVCFTTDSTPLINGELKSTKGCFIPDDGAITAMQDDGSGNLTGLQTMIDAGWEF